MPSRERGEEYDVQQRDTGRIEGIGRPCITTRRFQFAEDEADRAGNDANSELDRRRQPAVLHRIADEEAAGEEERDGRDNREKLHADECFPIE